MKKPETTLGYAAKTFAFTALAALLCFFLHMSITMVLSIASTQVLGSRTGGVLEDGRTLVVEDLLANGDKGAHRKVYILEKDDSETVLVDADVDDLAVLGTRRSGTLEDGRALIVEEWKATADKAARRKIFIRDAEGKETVLVDREVADENDTDEEILKQYPTEGDNTIQIREDEELLLQYPVTQGYKENIRSAVDPVMRNLSSSVAQILMLILFLAFPYSDMWYLGDSDRNNVQFGHRPEDKWRGAKIGLVASIPAILMWLVLVAGKLAGALPGFVKWYRWFNVCFWPYMDGVIPSTVMDPAAAPWGGVLAMLVAALLLPVITGVGYLLGYKEFSIRDRLVYTATGKKVKHRKRR